MNTAKIYHDLDGDEKTIHQMVKYEPQWAAARIQAGEEALRRLHKLHEILTGDSIFMDHEEIEKMRELCRLEMRGG